MGQLVEVPGHGQVEFPDGMNDSDIATAIKNNMMRTPVGAPTPAPQKTTKVNGGDWGQGFPKFADWLANFVSATAQKDLGLSPSAAAVPGAVTYGLTQAVPMLATATRGGPGSVAAEVPSLTSAPSRWLMQSAVKPSSTLSPQDVKAALNTMLQENIYPTSSGMNKASGITKLLDQQVDSILANSPARVSVPAVGLEGQPGLEMGHCRCGGGRGGLQDGVGAQSGRHGTAPGEGAPRSGQGALRAIGRKADMR